MAVLVLLSVILVRNLKVENPGKKQLALESIITTFNNLFSDVMGEKGKAYIPLSLIHISEPTRRS